MQGALHDVASVFRIILLLGFCFAGIAKLRDVARFRQTLVDFGVPRALVRAAAVALPVLEILTAAALAISGVIGGGLALLLLLAFIVAIQANLMLGRRPNCHCFGQLKSAPIGIPILVRNAALAITAVVVIWEGFHPTSSVTAYVLGQTTDSERVMLILSGIQTALIAGVIAIGWQLLKQQGRMLIRLDGMERGATGEPAAIHSSDQPRIGLPLGELAPDFALTNLLGHSVYLKELLERNAPLLLVFSSPQCGPCQHLLPDLEGWDERLDSKLTIVIVSEGQAGEHNDYPIPERVLLQQNREVAELYQAWGTPSAVLLQPDGSIGSGVAAGFEQIEALIGSVERMSGPWGSIGIGSSLSLQPGEYASQLKLPGLDGVRRAVLQSRETDTLLVFWNTQCGFCRQMEGRLKRWIENRPPGGPDLVLIANGSISDLRALEPPGRVFIDTGFAIGAAYGARGTPMAVLVDPQGRTASNVVSGEEAIFALLERTSETEQSSWHGHGSLERGPARLA